MASVRVAVNSSVLEWALDRTSADAATLEKLPVRAWITGGISPTFKQLEDFARRSRTPIGLLLMEQPPEIELPLTDFRRLPSGAAGTPSDELLHVVHLAERRQAWYREYAERLGQEPLAFVGSLEVSSDPRGAATTIRDALHFAVDGRRSAGDWTGTRSALAEAAEELGILVVIAGYAAANTKRTLEVEEFRGFSLVDDLAPLVFVNARDTKAAQLFTLLHEIARVYLGTSGVDRPDPALPHDDPVERWCNEVAAEILVPTTTLLEAHDPTRPLSEEASRLAGIFRASGLVVLAQLHAVGRLTWDEYVTARDRERGAAMEALEDSNSSGGNYYNTAPVMIGHSFLRALMADVRAGTTSYTEAMALTEARSLKALEGLAESGVAP